MTDFAASCYYARHDGTEDADTPPERDLSTVRGAAAWGLELARVLRPGREVLMPKWRSRETASSTFHDAASHCAGVCARQVADGHVTNARRYALAHRHLLDLADRADAARVSRAGGAT